MKGDALYLLHILERITRSEEYTIDGEEAFLADGKTQDAVIRNFEVIGEATKRVSRETKALNPEVPWKLLAGFRDVLIHNYNGVRLSLVWDAIQRDLPGLREPVEELFQRLRAAEDSA
jgi:uncharacterized protein with HEPN domain